MRKITESALSHWLGIKHLFEKGIFLFLFCLPLGLGSSVPEGDKTFGARTAAWSYRTSLPELQHPPDWKVIKVVLTHRTISPFQW